MNPRDHPHGGGEGKAPIGGQPKTKWGKPAFQRTRNNKRTDSMIVRRRHGNESDDSRRDGQEHLTCRGGSVGRSSKKGPYIDPKLQEKIETLNRTNERRVIRTWARASTIFPGMVGHTVAVHNGRSARPDLRVTEQMVGHKLGEFAPTRTFRGHGKDADRRGRR